MNSESKIGVFISEEEIHDAVAVVARRIENYYTSVIGIKPSNTNLEQQPPLVLLCVLKGAAKFHAALSNELKIPHAVDYIRTKSYVGMQSAGMVQIDGFGTNDISSKGPQFNWAGRHVLIVEDIVDTGLTLLKLTERILERESPASLHTCTLLDKPSGRKYDITPKFIGIELKGSPFVIGYGLDYNEHFRDLSYIGVVSEEKK